MTSRFLSVFAILAFCGLILPGSAVADWYENFDSYVLGSGLHGQGGWHGWDGNSAADAYVSDAYARSVPYSAEVAAASDIVHEYAGYTTDTWVYKAWQYVPTDFSGSTYFLLLNTYNDLGPYNWSTQVRFESAGMIVTSDPEGLTLPLIVGQWVEIRVEIDLIMNTQSFFYNGQLLSQKSWTEGVSGGGVLSIAAVDLFANGATPVYYDDMSLAPPGSTPVEATSWGRVKQMFR